MSKKDKYYSLSRIRERGARYNVIFGERSNGKTFSVLDLGVENYCKTKKQMAIIRRYDLDFQGKRGQTLFDGIVKEGKVFQYSGGLWSDVGYIGGRWYLRRRDDELDKWIYDETPFAYGFSLAAMEHDKSTSYPDITTILFDEFLTRGVYLKDEFVIFMNVLSTIIRDRDDVTIYMLGNTVNQYSPYFAEMGIDVKHMKPGDIDVYRYGQSELTVAVEYADAPNKGKPSDVYFAFNNPRLNMIKTGAWELDIYPHKPFDFEAKDIRFKYFVIFDGETLQCEIIKKGRNEITYIHRKTGEIKNPDRDVVYTPDYDPRPNWRRNIKKPIFDFEKRLLWYFASDKVFYQDNEVGEIMRNYLNWCAS